MDDRTTLVLPESLGGLPIVALGSESCANLADVEEVKLPPRLRQIGYRAFEGCSSLKSIVLPRCLKFIEGEAFKDCEKLSTIDLHEGMGVDVVSGGEIFTAYKAGVDMSKELFNGNNKTISGLYYNSEEKDQLGLFGDCFNATIKNVTIADSYFKGKNQILH